MERDDDLSDISGVTSQGGDETNSYSLREILEETFGKAVTMKDFFPDVNTFN